MSLVRMNHELNKMRPSAVYNEEDPNFPKTMPDDNAGIDKNLAFLPEYRKLYSQTIFPDL